LIFVIVFGNRIGGIICGATRNGDYMWRISFCLLQAVDFSSFITDFDEIFRNYSGKFGMK